MRLLRDILCLLDVSNAGNVAEQNEMPVSEARKKWVALSSQHTRDYAGNLPVICRLKIGQLEFAVCDVWVKKATAVKTTAAAGLRSEAAAGADQPAFMAAERI